jgi:malonate-semialdehyde dehydrogenase (acetylating)/methylmalonate-semialdehyde dehydrogenase
MERIHHLIDGKGVESTSGRTGPVFDPGTGQQTAEVGFASVAEVDAAVDSAARAFPGWRATSVAARTKLMFRFRELVERHSGDIARVLSDQQGKTLADARGEVARGLENVEYACGFAEAGAGRFTEQASTDIDVYEIRQPLGVCAGITPFNFPALVPLWMIPNAIATGNTFVLKPSEKDPGPPNLVVELFWEAGLPDGVLNVVQGDKVAVDRLLEHPEIKAVSFVGSTPVARYIYETGTSNGKRVQALAGAKNHMIVLPDADVGMAADAAVGAGYGSSGERCMAVSVVVAVGDVGDRLVEEISHRISNLVVGPGADPASEMGPLITREHRDRVASYVGLGEEQGAVVAVDGREWSFDGDGFLIGPSLLDRVTPDMDVYRDEIFGPVLSVVRADRYQDAVDLIRANPWGNGAAIFTRDGGVARRFQFDVEAGMVGINVPVPVPVAYYSFGGWGDSLFGDTHMYGPDGLRFFTRGKVVTSRWPDPALSTIDLGFPTNK